MFENVDGRRTDARVTGILLVHLGVFGSGELIMGLENQFSVFLGLAVLHRFYCI